MRVLLALIDEWTNDGRLIKPDALVLPDSCPVFPAHLDPYRRTMAIGRASDFGYTDDVPVRLWADLEIPPVHARPVAHLGLGDVDVRYGENGRMTFERATISYISMAADRNWAWDIPFDVQLKEMP